MSGREAMYYWGVKLIDAILSIFIPIVKFVLYPLISLVRHINSFVWVDDRQLSFNDRIQKWWLSNGIIIIIICWFSLILTNIIWAYQTGNLFQSDDPKNRTFFSDYSDIINYLFLCPLYISLGVTFIFYILRLRESQSSVFRLLNIPVKHHRLSERTVFYWTIFIILVALMIMSGYGRELDRYDVKYWFQDIKNDVKHLNYHGYYYIAFNTIISVIFVGIVAAHFELFRFSSLIVNYFKRNKSPLLESKPDQLFTAPNVRNEFVPFTSLYVVSKILVFLLLLNLYTWRNQGVNFIGMLDVSVLAYYILGVILLAFPRYHIQNALFQLWKESGSDEYVDLRSTTQKGIANLVDYFVLGAAVVNLLDESIRRLGYSDGVFNLFLGK
jgi:hypothetical protein